MSSQFLHHEVSILTGARLHFGPLSYQPAAGRHFGGIGVMIDQPGWHLRIRPQRSAENSPRTSENSPRIHGLQVERVGQMLARLTPEQRVAWQLNDIEIEVLNAIPPHRGLGSGTQLALALGHGLSQLAVRAGFCETNATTEMIARHFQRGTRSAIGIAGFDQGGFLVDAGQRAPHNIGEIACRSPFPEPWRIVLLYPVAGESQYAGQAERQAFQQLVSMSEATSGRLARLVLTEILPALNRHRCDDLNAALDEYGMLVGEFFRPVQGGVFAHSGMAAVVEQLQRAGTRGLVQSSWGPTIAHVVPSVVAAEEFVNQVRRLDVLPLETQVVSGWNSGSLSS